MKPAPPVMIIMEAEYKGLSLSLQPDKGHRGLFAIYGFCGVAGERIEIALLWLGGQGHAFADAQDGAYDKADDHGPAGSAEEVVPVAEGQQIFATSSYSHSSKDKQSTPS